MFYRFETYSFPAIRIVAFTVAFYKMLVMIAFLN